MWIFVLFCQKARYDGLYGYVSQVRFCLVLIFQLCKRIAVQIYTCIFVSLANFIQKKIRIHANLYKQVIHVINIYLNSRQLLHFFMQV